MSGKMTMFGNRVLESTTKRLFLPSLMPVRFKAIRAQRYPTYDESCLQKIAEPYMRPKVMLPDHLACKAAEEAKYAVEEDHPYEILLGKLVRKMFESNKFIAICHLNSISSSESFEVRKKFFKIGMDYHKHPKRVFELAVQGTRYESITPLFNGFWQDVIIFGKEPDVAAFLKLEKKIPEVTLLAAIVEDRFLSKSHLIEFAKLPSLDTARSQLCATLDQVGQHVMANLSSHQSRLHSLLTQYVQERSKED